MFNHNGPREVGVLLVSMLLSAESADFWSFILPSIM